MEISCKGTVELSKSSPPSNGLLDKMYPPYRSIVQAIHQTQVRPTGISSRFSHNNTKGNNRQKSITYLTLSPSLFVLQNVHISIPRRPSSTFFFSFPSLYILVACTQSYANKAWGESQQSRHTHTQESQNPIHISQEKGTNPEDHGE